MREKAEVLKIRTARIILEALQLVKNLMMTYLKFTWKRSTKRVNNLNKSQLKGVCIAFIPQYFLLMRFKGKNTKLKMNWQKLIKEKLKKILKLMVNLKKLIGVNITKRNEMKIIQSKRVTIDFNKKKFSHKEKTTLSKLYLIRLQ